MVMYKVRTSFSAAKRTSGLLVPEFLKSAYCAMAEMMLSQINDRRFEMLVKAVVDYAIYMLDPRGHIASWNPGAERIKGYSEQEILGFHYECFFTPEDRQAGTPNFALANASKNGRYESEGWRVRKDGSRFWASVVVDSIRDENGQLIGFAKVTRDMTEHRNAQIALALTREQLAQAQKMEAIGKLTGGVAHDFNNLLMIINGYADILKRRLTADEDLAALETIRHAAHRGRNLTRQLLAFSRREPLNPVVVDLEQQFKVMKDLIQGSLRGDLELSIEIQPDLFPVRVDVGELELAIVNLAMNARDAMPRGGQLTIQVRKVQLPNGDVPHLRGRFIAISVIDTGTGIAPEHLSKIFDPFFTTKDSDSGSGLGLPQVYGFASRSGGAVTVRSQLGQGAAFTIYLPRAREVGGAAQMPEPSVPAELPGGMALLVEDNLDVGNVTASMLYELGYRVVRANNANEALDHLRAGVRIDIVLTDIVMPGEMNGIELEKFIKRNYPLLPVLLVTGYSGDSFKQERLQPVLRKPFDIDMLRRALLEVIEHNPQDE